MWLCTLPIGQNTAFQASSKSKYGITVCQNMAFALTVCQKVRICLFTLAVGQNMAVPVFMAFVCITGLPDSFEFILYRTTQNKQ